MLFFLPIRGCVAEVVQSCFGEDRMTENRVIIEPLGPDSFALSFPYDDNLVAMVRRLGNRRWNKRAKRWEIGICHLGEVAHVAGQTGGTLAIGQDRLNGRVDRFLRARRDHHGRALPGEGLGDAQAKPAASPGDHGDFVFQNEHAFPR